MILQDSCACMLGELLYQNVISINFSKAGSSILFQKLIVVFHKFRFKVREDLWAIISLEMFVRLFSFEWFTYLLGFEGFTSLFNLDGFINLFSHLYFRRVYSPL